ncbi:MAG: acetaldehyde dehydrogenase (acetylating) [Myxococcales bacterium]|nr:acetaldehyde dehydrogenase (acetylating) [Deltaproteobacteria bacterium]NNL25861.1 acetaldehyde dehydrogenase (acetylating) [Myxococcales bacterium]
MTVTCAIVGSGNIGTDLMKKVLSRGKNLELVGLVGIDPESDGLARARKLGVPTSSEGLSGFLASTNGNAPKILFDATSAGAHKAHDAMAREAGMQVVDLTPAAIGPYVVPVVNLDDHLSGSNVNMVTCGGQATVPIVHAVSRVAEVHYAEIVASISSRSAGPGTRANIDEFTETTAQALEVVGGAKTGKAIIILNPAEPPLIMRDTVYTFSDEADEASIAGSIQRTVAAVQAYVPGYRLAQEVQFEHFDSDNPLRLPGLAPMTGVKTSVFLEVEGAGDYLPPYAGNLDIMTSAALAVGETFATRILGGTP